MNDNINEKIIEKINDMNIDDNKKMFIVDVLDFEHDIANQSKPKYSAKYRELLNKYI